MNGDEKIQPIALTREEGEALWFLGVLAIIKASGETTGGRCAIIEHLAPRGAGSPLHVHSREDEWFYVLDGELTFWVGGRVIKARGGRRSCMDRVACRTRSCRQLDGGALPARRRAGWLREFHARAGRAGEGSQPAAAGGQAAGCRASDEGGRGLRY